MNLNVHYRILVKTTCNRFRETEISGLEDAPSVSLKQEELKSVWFQPSVAIFLPLYIDAI